MTYEDIYPILCYECKKNVRECECEDWSEPRICDSCGGDVHEHFIDDDWNLTHCHKCRKIYGIIAFERLSKKEKNKNES